MASETEAEKPNAPKKSNKLLILIAAAVLTLGGGGGAYWFLIASKPKVAAEPEKKLTSFIDIKDMMIGIQPDRTDQAERTHLLKVKISLEVADAHDVPKVQPLMPRVEDVFQTYLRELRPADIRGSAGLMFLKEELLRRVNIAVAPVHIDAILFKEIVVQ